MRLLMKFGGTSVGDGQRIRRVVEILEPYHAQGHELAVVVSALSGVTGQLIETATEEFIENLRSRHRSALEAVAPDYVDEVGRILDARLADLQAMLFGLHIL